MELIACILVAVFILATSQFTLSVSMEMENLLQQEWTSFKLRYNKTYKTEDENYFRKEIFIENRHKINIFNQEYGQNKWTFVQQVNPYADMLHHEFHRRFNGFNIQLKSKVTVTPPSSYLTSANVIYYDYVNWLELGAVSPVKNQGPCGSCWAFSAVGALEGQNFRKTGKLVEFSAQNLIDCSNSYEGCLGGLIDTAFDYVRNNPRIDTEASYPYEAIDGPCRFRNETAEGECTGYVAIREGSEKELEAAVATLGPVAVAIDASKRNLQFYSNGVYYDPECGKNLEELNHAVLVVGYGTEPNGQKYWLVKNSYGSQWGIGGYMKMAKFANNLCGIATHALYPLV